MIGKKYKELNTNSIVEIIGQIGEVITLSNGNSVRLPRLKDERMYEEYIDPATFFNKSNYTIGNISNVNNVPNDFIEETRYDNDIQSLYQEDPSEAKRLLLEKARNMGLNSNNEMQKQLNSFSNIVELEPTMTPFRPQNQQIAPQQINPNIPENLQYPQHFSTPQQQNSSGEQKNEDPIFKMFQNAKRNTDFRFELSIEDKIPNTQFIALMEDSYNTSIIDFLADEFVNKILSNPELLKTKIKAKINSMVGASSNKELLSEVKKEIPAKKRQVKK